MLSHTNARPDIWMQQQHLSRMVQWRAIGRIRCKPLKNTPKRTAGPYGILGLQQGRMDVSFSVSRVSLSCCSAHAYWSAFNSLLLTVQVNTLVSIPVSRIGLRTISGSNIGSNYQIKQNSRHDEERNFILLLSMYSLLGNTGFFLCMHKHNSMPFFSCVMKWLINS